MNGVSDKNKKILLVQLLKCLVYVLVQVINQQ